GLISLICLVGLFRHLARADISSEITEASAPLQEGVPEVAVARLQALLDRNLPDAERRAVVEKLAEAQGAGKELDDTLDLLVVPRRGGSGQKRDRPPLPNQETAARDAVGWSGFCSDRKVR